MMTDDMELVRQFAVHKSESAFAEIVSRHTNLVFSAASRRVRDIQLAEEIVQAVFVILAQKASSLNSGTILSGWLYRCACFTSNCALRTEYRRKNYEQQAHMESTIRQAGTDVAWQQISPQLEEAMLRLNKTDHDALVLRFFEGRTLKEIGAAIGTSEEAAKKRVNRSLSKLHSYLQKRGMTSTVSLMAEAIIINSVQAAPVALAKSVAATVLTTSPITKSSVSTLIKGALKIMAWSKVKTAIVAGGIVLMAVGTTTVTFKAVAKHREDAVWSQLTRIDSRLLESAPPTISMRQVPLNSKFIGTVRVRSGKMMGLGAAVADILSCAYSIDKDRIVDSERLPAGKYDFIACNPNHSSEAMQAEIKNKTGLSARREMRETDVLLLKVVKQNVSGLRGSSDDVSGSSGRSKPGEFIGENQPILALAFFLENRLKLPVIDQTGLTGRYDIGLYWSEPGGYQNPNDEGLKQSLLDTLGLDLEPARQSIEMLVVEKGK